MLGKTHKNNTKNIQGNKEFVCTGQLLGLESALTCNRYIQWHSTGEHWFFFFPSRYQLQTVLGLGSDFVSTTPYWDLVWFELVQTLCILSQCLCVCETLKDCLVFIISFNKHKHSQIFLFICAAAWTMGRNSHVFTRPFWCHAVHGNAESKTLCAAGSTMGRPCWEKHCLAGGGIIQECPSSSKWLQCPLYSIAGQLSINMQGTHGPLADCFHS